METKEFEIKKEKWLQEVADGCHEIATEIDLDFYIFQTPIIYNPDLLLIGINPGSNNSYSKMLKEKGVKKREASSLYYNENLLVEEANDWKDGMGAVRNKFKEIFFDDYLFSQLKNSVMMNMYYFNTKSSMDIKNLDAELKAYCLEKTKEFIDIINPKNIVFFTSDKSILAKIGVKEIQQVDTFLKIGKLNDHKIISIPHFSARGYNSKSIRNNIGKQLKKVLKSK